ncbi:MAG TPA: amino acid ABC transporter substrate-binding protein [Desulfobulbaceae bacterium]|nr:amino acid ABC transporter substrate-binding protein [Desulfobulbaceae bacterium]
MDRQHGRWKLLLSFSLLLLFVVFLFSCHSHQPLAPISLGLAINLSGRGGAAGEDIRDGAILAVNTINTTGGINGRPLKLLVRDDRNTPEGIRAADQSLAAEGVSAIIGHSTSGNTLLSYPFVTAQGILLITPYAATNKLSGKDDLFVRTQVNCDLYGKKAASLFERRAIGSVALLMDMSNADFVVDWKDSLQKYYHGRIDTVMFNSRKEVHWSEIIASLSAMKTDAVLLLTEASMSGVALQKLEAAGYDGGRFATVWADTPELLRYAGGSAENLRIITFIDPKNERPGYIAFSRAMEKSFHKKATARSSRAYEVVFILADALKRRTENTATGLKNALLDGEYNTILGHLHFDKYGDVVRPIYEVMVHDNQFQSNGSI